MLFDATTLAEIIKKRIDQLKGKEKKKRQIAMIVGTPVFILCMFFLVQLVFLGGSLTTLDLMNPTTVYIPPMIQEVTNGSWFMLFIFMILLSTAIVAIGYGYYDVFRRWKKVDDFVDGFVEELMI